MIGIVLCKQNQHGSPLPATSFKRCATVALVSACITILAVAHASIPFPEQAYAATWPLGGSQASVITSFHDMYTYRGNELRHSGIDIAAEAGSAVLAPASGTISFVGEVPAGDSYLSDEGSGETALAASILLSDGRTLTLMPLNDPLIAEGDGVAEGDCIGMLAATGDRSSSKTHLHVGLKRAGTYFDPLALLGASTTLTGEEPSEREEPAAVPEKAPEQAYGQAVASEELVAVSSQAPAIDASESGTISSGHAVWNDQPDQEPLSLEAMAGSALQNVCYACVCQWEALNAGVRSLSCALGISAFVVSTVLFAAATLALAACIWSSVLLLKRVRKAFGEKENWVLCRFWGGGIMHKLFPAPGTSFITRGR